MEEQKEQDYVRPRFYKWIIIKNKSYNLRRKIPGYEGFSDINEVIEDAINVRKGVMGLGARPIDIIEIEDCDFKSFEQLFRNLTSEICNNWDRGRDFTLIFFYYAGHGLMENFTFAVVNEIKKARFPLEKFLRVLGTTPGAYVLGVFDCCREKFSAEMRGPNDKTNNFIDEIGNYRNTLLSFACPPNSGVAARSTVAVSYFEKLRELAHPYDGSVILPGHFLTWQLGDGGEHVPLYTHQLRLVHSDWESKGPPPRTIAEL